MYASTWSRFMQKCPCPTQDGAPDGPNLAGYRKKRIVARFRTFPPKSSLLPSWRNSSVRAQMAEHCGVGHAATRCLSLPAYEICLFRELSWSCADDLWPMHRLQSCNQDSRRVGPSLMSQLPSPNLATLAPALLNACQPTLPQIPPHYRACTTNNFIAQDQGLVGRHTPDQWNNVSGASVVCFLRTDRHRVEPGARICIST